MPSRGLFDSDQRAVVVAPGINLCIRGRRPSGQARGDESRRVYAAGSYASTAYTTGRRWTAIHSCVIGCVVRCEGVRGFRRRAACAGRLRPPRASRRSSPAACRRPRRSRAVRRRRRRRSGAISLTICPALTRPVRSGVTATTIWTLPSFADASTTTPLLIFAFSESARPRSASLSRSARPSGARASRPATSIVSSAAVAAAAAAHRRPSS